jgi:hypothetical protein
VDADHPEVAARVREAIPVLRIADKISKAPLTVLKELA